MREYVLHSDAIRALDETAHFYGERFENGDEQFLTEIESTLAFLCLHPKIGSPYRNDVRRWRLNRFNRSLFYVPWDGHIFVLAVPHDSRDPDYWLDRTDSPSPP